MDWRKLFSRHRKEDSEPPVPFEDHLDISQREALLADFPLSADLEKNLEAIADLYGNSPDLVVRRFKVGPQRLATALVFLEGMTNVEAIEHLMDTVQIEVFKTNTKTTSRNLLPQTILESLLPTLEIREIQTLKELCNGLSSGKAALLFDDRDSVTLCGVEGWETRAMEEPSAETTIRGPRDGFVENIRTNTALIRRRIKTPNLWLESHLMGRLTQTKVSMAFIKGLASEELLAEVRSRLDRIQKDAVLESGYVEEYIENTPYTLFPLVFRTERPDRVASCLLEGKVAIFTDGTPFVLVVPTNFFKMLHSPEDYYEKVHIGTFLRCLRLLAYFISVLLPGTYVAAVSFHQELIPTTLLLRITAGRQGIPFPIVVEALLMEATFEFLREAGVRLPREIGSAISIVGALVLGDAAIRAGIVSPTMVIVVALTAIASFTAPVFSLAISGRILRFVFIGLGGSLGFFGLQGGILLTLIHLCSLRSFGTPYMTPTGPLVWSEWKDFLIRTWHWGMTTRPKLMGYREPRRAVKGQQPGPRRQQGRKKK